MNFCLIVFAPKVIPKCLPGFQKLLLIKLNFFLKRPELPAVLAATHMNSEINPVAIVEHQQIKNVIEGRCKFAIILRGGKFFRSSSKIIPIRVAITLLAIKLFIVLIAPTTVQTEYIAC